MNPEYKNACFQAIPDQLPSSFCIVTAWNPRGETASLHENRQRDVELRNFLDGKSIPRTRITGISEDGSHGEPGWAVACSVDSGLALGKQFDQEAIYHVTEEGALSLVSCSDESCEDLGDFICRVRNPRQNLQFSVLLPPPHGGDRFQATDELEIRFRAAKWFKKFSLLKKELNNGNQSSDLIELSVVSERPTDLISLIDDFRISLSIATLQVVHRGIAQDIHDWTDTPEIFEAWDIPLCP
jgi:hypothetical protein